MKYALADDYEDHNGTIDILIGANYVWDFITGAKMTSGGIHVIPSTVGLMLAGHLPLDKSVADDNSPVPTMLCITESFNRYPSEIGLVAVQSKAQINYDIDEYWNLESIGIRDDPVLAEDDQVQNEFERSVYFENGRYHVAWPWIAEKKQLLPTNYELSLGRFRSLSKRLKAEPELLQKYQEVIQTQVSRGIIEKVPNKDVYNSKNTIHYLPHHPIIKPQSSTTKVRIVYDASSKVRRDLVSLNECLHRGPVILPDLCAILIRFQTHPIAIVADIEKAFLQVGLRATERDVTRFLWFEDPTIPTINNNIAVYRFCRVAFGMISSPFLLAATIRHHLKSEKTQFGNQLANDLYVDNTISGANSEADAIKFYDDAKSIFQRAGMNLQEWRSNSGNLMSHIPKPDHSKDSDTKVLGLRWDSSSGNNIRITSVNWEKHTHCSTKRDILRAVASIFDPLGRYQPVLLPAKLFLQSLWETNLQWDDTLPTELQERWIQIHRDIGAIFDHRIPRYIGTPNSESELCVFTDASSKSYATAVYIRIPNASGCASSLVFAKSRLAPRQKTITIPRLELLGATIGVKAACFVREALKVNIPIVIFIDSECVIQWIKSKRQLSRFVNNRVQAIRQLPNCEFRYVTSQDNPADISTRGMTANALTTCNRWWDGPGWLRANRSDWPQRQNIGVITDEVLKNIEAEMSPYPVSHTLAAPEGRPADEATPLSINPDQFSSLQKLIRVTAICLKFLKKIIWDKLSPETQQTSSAKPIFEHISSQNSIFSDDFQSAKLTWIKHLQRSKFIDVYQAIKNQRSHLLITQLGLNVDFNGFICSYSRLHHADLPEEMKFPLLLPKNNRFTWLVVQDCHEKLLHSGVSHTLSQTRREFWIPQGRSYVRKVLNRCLICRRHKGAPFALPNMPPWPIERVSRSSPFQFVGLDYFGPINVKVNDVVMKMWVCLFTCMATRAVHLEWVCDCTSQEFLNCFIRFVSRMGAPEQVVSDNAPQFRLVKSLADRAWHRALTNEDLLSYAAKQGIRWKFIIELAPWQGGFYERLVGIVKSALKISIGRRLLTWEAFVTLLAETEAIVNSRPLTYVGCDPDSNLLILRPIDFITDRPPGVPIGTEDEPVARSQLGDAGRRLASYWKQRKKHLQQIWDHWYHEYLLGLRERGKAIHRGKRSEVNDHPKVDEVVLLRDKDVPRGAWKLVRIIQLLRNSDNQVNGAEVILPSGTHLRRPINLLYPLEIDNPEPQLTDEPTANKSEETTSVPGSHVNFDGSDTESLGPFDGFSESEVQDAVSRRPTAGNAVILTLEGDPISFSDECRAVAERNICASLMSASPAL